MNLIAILLIALTVLVTSQTSHPTRKIPIHKGIAKEIQPFVNDYRVLAGKLGIHFVKPVTIGITKIGTPPTIGLCYMGNSFREIDIDKEYWEGASETGKKALVFHELTHCFCERDHDYGFEQFYPNVEKIKSTVGKKKPGYMDDGCPLSIMHPIILSDDCMEDHYDHYIKEMFDRCEPW